MTHHSEMTELGFRRFIILCTPTQQLGENYVLKHMVTKSKRQNQIDFAY